jgi:hypothetical protein
MSLVETEDRYVDLLITNSVQTQANERVPINFIQNQSQPILKSTNGYQLSIIRFSLNTETLPIFIPSMQSKDVTIYSVTMELNGKQYQQFMQFESQNANPLDPDEYYYIHSYQYVIYLMNKCLASCLTGLRALTTCPTSIAPVMSFDSNTMKCTLNLDDDYYGYNETNKINIYMNSALYALLASLPANIVNKNKLGMDVQINNIMAQSPIALTQDYSTVSLWNPVSSIIFTSNLIPIYQSQVPPIQIYENGKVVNNNSTFNYLNVVTDFVADNMQFVPYIQYSASVFRFLSLKQNSEIRNIDLQIYWQNRNNGKLKPVYLGLGGSCSVKLFLTRI